MWIAIIVSAFIAFGVGAYMKKSNDPEEQRIGQEIEQDAEQILKDSI